MQDFLRNPGFELGDRDWTKGDGWTIEKDAANARSGSWVAKIAGGSATTMESESFSVRPGLDISGAAWFKHTSSYDAPTDVHIRWLDKDGSVISEADGSNVAAGTTSYTESTVSGTAPDKAKSFDLSLKSGAETTGTAWADDISASGDIIESLPASAKIRTDTFRLQRTTSAFRPLIGSLISSNFNGGKSDSWLGVFTFTSMAPSGDLGELVAMLERVGKTERFFAFDPNRKVPKNGVVNGLVVDGAGQTGNAIKVRGGTADTTALVGGDYSEVRDQYFQLTRDLEIGPEETGIMHVIPAIRTSPADGEPVITDNPKIVAHVTSGIPRESDVAKRASLSISWKEWI